MSYNTDPSTGEERDRQPPYQHTHALLLTGLYVGPQKSQEGSKVGFWKR